MSQNLNILVGLDLDSAQKEQLAKTAGLANIKYILPKEATADDVANADIIIGNVPPSVVKSAQRLKWMQLNSAGTNGYLEDGVLKNGALLTNATGAYGTSISEYMMGVLLYFYRKLNLYHENSRQSLWKIEGTVRSVYGARALVVGLGDIGGSFAKILKTMGATTVGIRRQSTIKPDFLDELYHPDQLDEELKKADIVAISVPGTPETINMFGKKQLEAMKQDSVLINVGRGSVIDTDALCAQLDTGKFYGIALDVTVPEPLPADHKLWKYPNVLITPHISGGYRMKETADIIFNIAHENLKLFLEEKPLQNLVDPATGYKYTDK